MKYIYSVGMLALSLFFFQSLSTPVQAGSAPEFTSCDYEHSNGEIFYCYHTEGWTGHALPLSVEAVDPDGGSLTYEWDLVDAGDGIYDTVGQNVYLLETDVDRSGDVSVRVTDSEGLSSVTWVVFDILIHPAVPYSITPDANPVVSSTTINMSGTFYDHGPESQLLESTVLWEWGDGTSSVGTIGNTVTYTKLHPLDSDLIGFVDVFGSHTYEEPGVYTVNLRTADHWGEEESKLFEYIVVYDPSGSASGNGSIVSPLGAYPADPTLTGIAKFGFTSRYKNGATVPDGKAQFKFKAGDFSFNSDTMEWLVVNQNNTNAQFKGTGKVNNESAPNNTSYKFMVWAQDLTAGDTFRIKIWYENIGTEVIVYDNGTNQTLESGKVIID